eukprot:2796640-Lingulodinium_polyedra.AAC.1
MVRPPSRAAGRVGRKRVAASATLRVVESAPVLRPIPLAARPAARILPEAARAKRQRQRSAFAMP